MSHDREYFRRRAAEERVAAMKSPHPGARRAHLELAERYDAVAESMGDIIAVGALRAHS
ncbi:MAG: hypothetical protein V4513_06800 [Pseudomonadota bacterium]